MALLHVIAGLVFLGLLVIVPGRSLLAGRHREQSTALERWAMESGVGVWTVGLVTGFLLISPVQVLGVTHAALVPFVVPAVALIAWVAARVLRKRTSDAPPALRAAEAGDYAVLALTGVVFALFFVGRDDQAYDVACLQVNAAVVTDNLVGHWGVVFSRGMFWPLQFEFLSLNDRFGLSLVTVPIIATLQAAGYRTVHGLFAALLFLSVAALGTRVSGRRLGGVVAAAFLLVTDDVLGSASLNANFIVAWTSALFLLSLRREEVARPWRRTFFAACLFMTRHIAIVGLGAWLWVQYRDAPAPRPVRHVVAHLAGFVALALPVWVCNLLGFGNPFWMSTFEEMGSHPHALFGWTFELPAMLNWPLFGELVRTPFLALPMWLGWPVHFYAQWGVVGLALIVLGAVRLYRQPSQRAGLAVWATFFVPVALVLGIQEHWLEPLKMTIALVFAPIWASLLAVGIVWLTALPRARAAAMLGASVVGTAVVTALLGVALSAVDATEDPRFRAEVVQLRTQTPDYDDWLKSRAFRWQWTPLTTAPELLSDLGRKITDAGYTVAHPTLSDRRTSAAEAMSRYHIPGAHELFLADPLAQPPVAFEPSRASRELRLSLERSPTIAEAPLSAAAADASAPRLDLTGGEPCVSTPRLSMHMPFADRAAGIIACRVSSEQVFAFLAFPTHVPPDHYEEEDIGEYRVPDFFFESGDFLDPDVATLPLVSEVGLILPEEVRRVSLFEVVMFEPGLMFRRDANIDAEGRIVVGEADRTWMN